MNITLKQGVIRGKENISRLTGKTYYSFLGIPYAEPPVNLLRFQAPRPHKGWDGILYATEDPPACAQKDKLKTPSDFGDENCLFVNVHVPENSSANNKLKPVMVFIHGGAFYVGSGSIHAPDFLINYDVIVVTFNYRLHVFGFLNLELPECPGNVGLKDQVMAFKWVKENIKAFGGDPFNITAFGESAGSASVHYLMLSPMSHGLFKKAILQSGTAINPWAYTEDHLENAFKLGHILGCNTTDKRELLNFLIEVPTFDIVNAMLRILGKTFASTLIHLPFAPSVEHGIDPRDVFLPKKPELLLENICNIPLMTGLTDLEGLIFLLGKDIPFFSRLNENFHIMPRDVKKLTSQPGVVNNKIREFYLRGKDVCEETFGEFVDLLSDVCFGNDLYDIVLPLLTKYQNTPVYFYRFSYEGKLNLMKQFSMMSFDLQLKGTCHGDDLFYLFYMNIGIDAPFEEEIHMINMMCNMWTNFAKTGSPSVESRNIEWRPTSIENPCYLHIDDKPVMKNGLINENRMNFWSKLRHELQLRKDLMRLKL